MKRSDLDTFTVLSAVADNPPLGSMDAFNKFCETYPPNLVLAAWNREIDAHRLDYGVSPRTSWITPEGRAWLDSHTTATR